MRRRILKTIAWIVGLLVISVILLLVYVQVVSKSKPPVVGLSAMDSALVVQLDTGLYTIGNNWFRKSESGLYELYVEGSPYDRGVVNGKLTKELVQYQEEVFNHQINKLVPSSFYRGVLTYFIGWFNRDLDNHVADEFKQEIYGISKVAAHDLDKIASPYQRILNYHGAHDIGHALQNMSLVGCTSFATWGEKSEDKSLIIGRNFDFYVGDEFARDKIVAFYHPAKGYKFMMVTFGGMTGVLSGMNDQGLTVTINAAKSEIPSSSATPVSLVAREILQYASTIKEAYAIAANRKMFVAESFLIGSAKDGKAALIEKTPEEIELVETLDEYIISTNHFQGKVLGQTKVNKDHIKTSASPYRFDRVKELLQADGKNSVIKTATILRNQQGLKNADIGMGNEKLINQLVAHHGIIFQPEKRLVWISTEPWQLGKFVCYDLSKIFSLSMKENKEVYEAQLAIPADTFLNSPDYHAYVKFSTYRFPFNSRQDLPSDSVVKWNPNSYHAYMLAGDRQMEEKNYADASIFYEKGLTKEIASLQEKEHMEKNLKYCKEHLP